MRILLDRKTIVQLFRGFSQAERSIHRALDPAAAWLDLQTYYSGEKTESVLRLVGQVAAIAHRSRPDLPLATKDELIASIPPAKLARVLFARFSARWRSSWPFLPLEVRFMATTWQSLLDCLA